MIARALFKQVTAVNQASKFAFSTVKTVPGNKPPRFEESVQGKYAGVLFSVASQDSQLDTVLNDMKYFAELNSQEIFRTFTSNQTMTQAQQKDILKALGSYEPITQQFLNVLVENKRVNALGKIAEKYVEYYKILNKEENIIVTSAKELSGDQKSKVEAALRKSRGENFTLSYKVDGAILGGLTMQSGMEFLDCSLATRFNRVKTELDGLAL